VARRYPTPTSSMVTSADQEQARHAGSGTTRPAYGAVSGGALNPTWVEWLMGWPLLYTLVKDASEGASALRARRAWKRLETAKRPSRRRSPGSSSGVR
jgi:hypothetical protein